MTDKNAGMHPQVVDKELLKNSGKDVHQVDPPIVSVAPASGPQGAQSSNLTDNKDLTQVSKPNRDLFLDKNAPKSQYQFTDLELDEGVFIPVEKNSTTDKLLSDVHKAIYQAKMQGAVIELDEKGDEIWENVTVMTKKRNDDGTIQLESSGKPITGANFTHIPKYLYPMNFIARAVTTEDEISEGQNAPSDGVLIIRVA
jgi:hypothetical protein